MLSGVDPEELVGRGLREPNLFGCPRGGPQGQIGIGHLSVLARGLPNYPLSGPLMARDKSLDLAEEDQVPFDSLDQQADRGLVDAEPSPDLRLALLLSEVGLKEETVPVGEPGGGLGEAIQCFLTGPRRPRKGCRIASKTRRKGIHTVCF